MSSQTRLLQRILKQIQVSEELFHFIRFRYNSTNLGELTFFLHLPEETDITRVKNRASEIDLTVLNRKLFQKNYAKVPVKW